MRRRSHQTPGLSYGQLEKRSMLAGLVTVILEDQVLTVIGDRESNVFTVDLTAETTDQLVQGQDNTNVQFTRGFDNGFDLANLEDLRIFAKNGDDVVTLYGGGTSLSDDVVISLAHGNDSLYVIGGRVEDDFFVFAGSNHDSVFLSDVHIGDDLRIAGNAGSDVMMLNGLTVEGNALGLGQHGHDTVLVNDSTFGDGVFFEMGEGADRYESIDSVYNDVVSIRGRAGHDSVLLDEDANDFYTSPRFLAVEREALTTDEFGQDTAALDKVKSDFFEFGSQVPAVTANAIQDNMAELASAYDLALFTLILDEDAQTVSIQDPTKTVSAAWDAAVQAAVVATGPGPTIASRAYAMMHTAMYDAWSAYDTVAVSTNLDDQLQRPASENTEANKIEAMSFAAYRVLDDLFSTQTEIFENVMDQYGLNSNDTSTDTTTPTGIGNQMAAALLAVRHADGSNQLGDAATGTAGVAYSDTTGYTPVNPTGDPTDIELWTPEFVPVDPVPGQTGAIQQFLTPQWGTVEAFGFDDANDFLPEAPQPFLLLDGTTDLDAKTITLANGVVWNIDKRLIGSVINPEFISQAEEVVELSANLTDEHKIIAEFWEDGGGTSFPPGTNMTFGQFVSARDNNSIDDDAKLFFALGNAVFDAGVATWNAKVVYDYVRPIRAIRELGELGLIGQFNSDLGGYAIDAWVPNNGTQTILATDFLTYQLPGGNVSPPFAEYTSGHSAFSAAGSRVLQLFTGSDEFGGSVTFSAGSAVFEDATPLDNVTLSWDTFSAAADEAGFSRLYGGIHFTEGDVNGRTLGEDVGDAAYQRAQFYINGGV